MPLLLIPFRKSQSRFINKRRCPCEWEPGIMQGCPDLGWFPRHISLGSIVSFLDNRYTVPKSSTPICKSLNGLHDSEGEYPTGYAPETIMSFHMLRTLISHIFPQTHNPNSIIPTQISRRKSLNPRSLRSSRLTILFRRLWSRP